LTLREILQEIALAVLEGKKDAALEGVRRGLDAGVNPLELITQGLTVGLDQVGVKFEEGEYYLPDMMLAAEAMSSAIDYLEPHLREERALSKEQVGRVVIGTVKGDLHSIGKDIVIMMMKAAGLEVTDLGVDVSSERFIKAVEDNEAGILGISALMTTTIGEQKKVIDLLAEKGLRDRVKVIVGGAPLSEEWAFKIGADAYAADAIAGVKKIKALLDLV
jgi:corrinoid protein of di/trimethylamine methyltransferase